MQLAERVSVVSCYRGHWESVFSAVCYLSPVMTETQNMLFICFLPSTACTANVAAQTLLALGTGAKSGLTVMQRGEN